MRSTTRLVLRVWIATLLVLTGCSGGEGRPATAPLTGSSQATSPSNSSTTSPGTAPGDASESTDPGVEDPGCRDRQQEVVLGSIYPLQKATGDVMSAVSGASPVGARRVAARAEIALSKVLEQCEHVPAAMRPFLAAARGVRGSLTQEDLTAVTAAYASWARATGQAPWAEQLVRAQRWCRTIQRHVTASYRVWWRWNDNERVWWIELSFDSDLVRALSATLHGAVRARGLTRSKVWAQQGYRTAGVLTWGGSSADEAVIRPGRSSILVAPSAGPYVSTAPDGSFEVQHVDVSVGAPRMRSPWCSLPVPERS